ARQRVLAGHAGRRPGDRAGPGRGHVQFRRGRPDRAGGRRVLRQRDQRHGRRRVGFHVPPDRREREVPDRVLAAGGGQAAPPAQAGAAGHPGGAGDRRRVGHRPRHGAPAGRRGRLGGHRRAGGGRGGAGGGGGGDRRGTHHPRAA